MSYYLKSIASLSGFLIALNLAACASIHRAGYYNFSVGRNSEEFSVDCANPVILKKWYAVYGTLEIGKTDLPLPDGNTGYRIQEFRDGGDMAVSILLGAFTSITRSSLSYSECKLTPKNQSSKANIEEAVRKIIDEYF